MLSDERVNEMWEHAIETSDPTAGQLRFIFARAIERESTAPLIEQIKGDEALMHKALAILDCVASDANIDIREFPTWLSVIPQLRQRLEAAK